MLVWKLYSSKEYLQSHSLVISQLLFFPFQSSFILGKQRFIDIVHVLDDLLCFYDKLKIRSFFNVVKEHILGKLCDTIVIHWATYTCILLKAALYIKMFTVTSIFLSYSNLCPALKTLFFTNSSLTIICSVNDILVVK